MSDTMILDPKTLTLDENYDPRSVSEEQRLKIFDFLTNIPAPFRIREVHQKGKYGRVMTIQPFSEVLDQLSEVVKKLAVNERLTTRKLEKYGSLNVQMGYWSKFYSGKKRILPLIKHIGINSVDLFMDREEVLDILQKYISREFVEETLFSEENGKNKFSSMANNIPELDRARQSLYHLASKDDNFKLENLVNKWYPDVLERKGFQASNILGFEDFGRENMSKYFNEKWYNGEVITRKALSLTGLGSSIVYQLTYRGAGKSSSAKKVKPKDYSKEVCKLMEYKNCKPNDIKADKGSFTSIGYIMEAEFAFIMSIVKKFDPFMSEFPELKKYFKGPLMHISTPQSRSELKIAKGDSDKYTDSIITSGDMNYLVEIKNTDYNQDRNFYSSLGNFASIETMANGKPIHKKILLISQHNGNLDKLESYCRDFGWAFMNIDDYNAAYHKAIDMLFNKIPSFSETSPLNKANILRDIHDFAFFNPHSIYTRGHRKLRVLSSELLKKNYRMINDGLEINNVSKYKSHYSMRLSDLLKVYKFNPSHLIPKDMVFVDVESLGSRNTGSPLFMIGTGYSTGDDFIADIYVSPTIFDEKEMLITVQEKLKEFNSIFTYNGKGVDVPFIEERLFTNRIRQEVHFNNHIDGYHDIIRKIVAGKHPSKLRNFEKIFLNIYRRGDISGEDIPEVIKNYHLGESDYIEDVIAHNFPDVFTMPFIYLFSKGHRFDKEITELNYYDFERLWDKNSDNTL